VVKETAWRILPSNYLGRVTAESAVLQPRNPLHLAQSFSSRNSNASIDGRYATTSIYIGGYNLEISSGARRRIGCSYCLGSTLTTIINLAFTDCQIPLILIITVIVVIIIILFLSIGGRRTFFFSLFFWLQFRGTNMGLGMRGGYLAKLVRVLVSI